MKPTHSPGPISRESPRRLMASVIAVPHAWLVVDEAE